MSTPIRVLLVEDSETDASLLIRRLRQGGYDPTFQRVETQPDMAAALGNQSWDIIISDYVLPRFSALDALDIFHQSGLDLPFLIVSGVAGEETAVGAMKAGAHDYIVKANLSRLVPAIEREMREAARRHEHKLLKEQLLLAQKMETVGRLAGGVAHDFNNLLTAIMGYAHAGTKNLDPGDTIHAYFEGIQQAAQRAANLTSQLLMFSRSRFVESKVTDLNQLMLDTAKMLRSVVGEDIEMVTLLAPDLRPVMADPEKLEQVFMNLAVNARDAMPNGGKLTIETSNAMLSGGVKSQDGETLLPGEYALVAVTDNGHGMTEEVRAHIFEPFFSTKEKGKGTGLGLSTCYGIVNQSQGHIEVESEPNQGTTVKVFLPTTNDGDDLLPEIESRQELKLHGETVLLVEDEPLVRAMVARILAEEGLSVLEAANGEEALRIAEKQDKGIIDLLLTDVVMPCMGGIELAQQLKALHPGTRVLLTSGYTDEAVLQHGALDPGTPFMHKPFLPMDLLHKVREVLES